MSKELVFENLIYLLGEEEAEKALEYEKPVHALKKLFNDKVAEYSHLSSHSLQGVYNSKLNSFLNALLSFKQEYPGSISSQPSQYRGCVKGRNLNHKLLINAYRNKSPSKELLSVLSGCEPGSNSNRNHLNLGVKTDNVTVYLDSHQFENPVQSIIGKITLLELVAPTTNKRAYELDFNPVSVGDFSNLNFSVTKPVEWCTTCYTPITNHTRIIEKRKASMHYLALPVEGGGSIEIATTRPEILPACAGVFVSPSDERVGKKVKVPFTNQIVNVIGDERVNPDLGTGSMCVGTFGDKSDYAWVEEHKLPVYSVIDDKGVLNENSGVVQGLTVELARERIISELEDKKLYNGVEVKTQKLPVCDICRTPVEFLPSELAAQAIKNRAVIREIVVMDALINELSLTEMLKR